MKSKDNKKFIDFHSVDENVLNEIEKEIFENKVRKFKDWLSKEGKNPDKFEGYAEQTVTNDGYRIRQFFTWVWYQSGEVKLTVTKEDADKFKSALLDDKIKKSNGQAYSGGSKRKLLDSVQRYFAHKHASSGCEMKEPWRHGINFNESRRSKVYWFTDDEREKIRKTILKLSHIPSYDELSPLEREEFKIKHAQREGIKKERIDKDYWKNLETSYKMPAMYYTALDIGTRTAEINRANVDWLSLEDGLNKIVIPPNEATKNDDYWECFIKEDTAILLKKWLKEREQKSKYDDTDALWLNREGNRYKSNSLKNHLVKVCKEANINTSGRNISWYSIRHSTGTCIWRETRDFNELKNQMRTKTIEAIMKYVHSNDEERKMTVEALS